ncbi:arylamine N-acetyltransferase family protein [Rhizorhapis sp. SPR117]|uniref:arylamine N-acetyltransferase family protein n=1 Tax=Rhizorhapis sp. SPR117 TaxID=2912611 RepID=UPI001F2E7995|nr:arylamine N-acetyltransferase [Rhizorhapis sp. SPR117]
MSGGFEKLIDLTAYLRRIGLTHAPPATIEGLMAVQRAHRLAIAFENLDISLGRGISLDPDAVFEKLVARRRGGYCFEQNQLFLRGLIAIGFEARPLLARVWLMADGMPPLTHTLNLVTLDDRQWIADAGFGGDFTPPMPLETGEIAEAPGNVLYRLIEDERGWLLQREDGKGWQDQYSFTLAPVEPCDLEVGNHWTSTRPGTRFTTLRTVSHALPDGRAGLIERQLSITRSGVTQEREIMDGRDYRAVLDNIFDLEITEQEVAALGLFGSD